MDAPDRPSPITDARFVREVDADARAVAGVRNQFAQWIRSHLVLDEERVSDIVLAVNEALANSAEFAYVTLPERVEGKRTLVRAGDVLLTITGVLLMFYYIPAEDRAYVASLMGRVVEPGKFANWISPPNMGINRQATDFEYVRFN